MKDMINIGIIGTGVGIRTHLKAFVQLNEVNVKGIVGSSPEKSQLYAKENGLEVGYSDYKELIDDPQIDLVCVTTPNLNHFHEVSYALNQRKHIIAEKPLAMNLKENNEIIQLAKKSKKLFIVNHQLRFNPYIQKIRDLICCGELGRIYHIKIHQQGTGFSNRKTNWMWSFDHELGGGVRLAMGSHLIDLINFWFPDYTYCNVYGSLDSVVDSRIDNEGIKKVVKASSYFSTNLTLSNMLNVQLSATAAAFGKSMFNISIYGTEGEIQFDLENKLTSATLKHKLSNESVNGVYEDEIENRTSIFRVSFKYFAPIVIKSIMNNDPTLVKDAATASDTYKTQIILDAIKESALNGTLVKLNESYSCNAMI